MEAQLTGIVGPRAYKSGDKSQVNLRLGTTGEMVFNELNGRYYEMVRSGIVFSACNPLSIAFTANNTTAQGFILTNPSGSGKALSVIEICVSLLSSPAGVCPMVISGSSNTQAAAVVHTTPMTIQNSLLGSTKVSVAKVDVNATMPAITIFRAIGGSPVGAGSTTAPFIKDEVAGALMLYPNTCISLQTLTNTLSMTVSMTWAEFPL